jgi:hypothetical protein
MISKLKPAAAVILGWALVLAIPHSSSAGTLSVAPANSSVVEGLTTGSGFVVFTFTPDLAPNFDTFINAPFAPTTTTSDTDLTDPDSLASVVVDQTGISTPCTPGVAAPDSGCQIRVDYHTFDAEGPPFVPPEPDSALNTITLDVFYTYTVISPSGTFHEDSKATALVTVSDIPEPSSLALFGMSLLGLCFLITCRSGRNGLDA